MVPTPFVVEVASILLFIDDGLFGGFVNGADGAQTSQISRSSSTLSPGMTIPLRGEKIFSILIAHSVLCAQNVEGHVLVLSILV